jgi:hypothetical protein
MNKHAVPATAAKAKRKALSFAMQVLPRDDPARNPNISRLKHLDVDLDQASRERCR